MTYIQTTATKKIFDLSKRIRFVNGGSSSSKTISILLWVIDYAQTHENKLISVVSETLPHLKKGAIRDFLNIMTEHQYYKDDKWNRTDLIYTFETGTKVEFFSADQPGKVRGPRRDVLYLNESNNIKYETYTQLEIRTRNIIWLDSNPTHEYWVYTEVIPNMDIDYITLTYKDNEALEKEIIDALESRKGSKNFYKVYVLGELGEAEGRIFTDWQALDKVPHEARLAARGLDFGYTHDPTVIVDIYEYNGGYIVDELLYQKGLHNKQIADFLLSQDNSVITIADSAEPKSIDEIRNYGVNIIGAKKGKGSVSQGIDFVQAQRMSITKRSTNAIKDYRNYLWKIDKDGKPLNVPEHMFSHACDAIRYGMTLFDRPDSTKDEAYLASVNKLLNPQKRHIPQDWKKPEEYHDYQRELKQMLQK